jgi:cell surface protein SprA
MMPNWRINYTGLQKIEFFKKFVKQLNIIHSYRSTYSVGSYATNLFYNPDEMDGLNYIRDLQMNFLPEREIGGISISEQFSPLISVDMQLVNSFTARIEMKKTRNLSLSFNNNQMMENKSDEYIIGLGYRFQQVPITIKTQGTAKKFQSDLDVRLDLSYRDTKMVMRKLEEDVNKLTSGMRRFVISFKADYTLSSRFRLRLFFDQDMNKPWVSSSFATTNTKVGFNLTFTLTN